MPSPLLALAFLVGFTLWAYRWAGCRWARWRHLLAVITVWAWCCCTPVIANALIARLEGPPPAEGEGARAPQAEGTHIVVLGSGRMWTPGRRSAPQLDESGWMRLHEGVRLWRHTGGTLVLTGGPGGADEPTLASLMGETARELGVPAHQVRLAFRSRTTYEDLAAAQTVMHGNGPIWLVTSAIHMPRALAVAKRIGLDAQPYPVDYLQIRHLTWRSWLPDNAAVERMDAALHEVVGRLYYQWRDRAS